MKHPRFVNGISSLREQSSRCVATIGSYDGVHRGHQVLLDRVCVLAKQLGLRSIVILFEPQPHEYFAKDNASPRIMRLREKVLALLEQGIDQVVCIKFDESLRSLSAEEFISQVLVDAAKIKYLVIGDDFRFGCDRKGDFTLLKAVSGRFGYSVENTQTQSEERERISSTRIRKLLENDNLTLAQSLLGKPYSIAGRVSYGKQLGRSIGFPTLNIALGRYRAPVSGVYAVRIKRDGRGENEVLQGVANIGTRPTVDGKNKPVLEVHIFDFNEQLYGQFVDVQFEKKIRREQKFASVDDLKRQITIDVDEAKQYFRQSH